MSDFPLSCAVIKRPDMFDTPSQSVKIVSINDAYFQTRDSYLQATVSVTSN